MTTHPTYVKMIMLSMITLKKATSKEIKEHIRKTWTKLASGARFSTCFEKAYQKQLVINIWNMMSHTKNIS